VTAEGAGGALRPFGDAAWRVELPGEGGADGYDEVRGRAGGRGRRAALEALRAVPRVVDAVVCEHHALVTFAPDAPPERDAVLAEITRALATPVEAGQAREHAVRVRYDGADLEEVARATGLGVAEVVARHAAATYEVAFVGFLPGFAYLRGLDARLVVARKPAPRTRVPALAVAIAGPYAGVYPFATPGGWNLLGTAVGFTPFDAARGAALAAGDRVRFVPESAP
jgi:UPF0271 protein